MTTLTPLFDWQEDREVDPGLVPLVGGTPELEGLRDIHDKAQRLVVAEKLATQCPEAIDLLRRIAATLAACTGSADTSPRVFDLATLDAAGQQLIEQVLGEGEVVATLHHDGQETRIRESVMPGLWRVRSRTLAAGQLVSDTIEVADIPAVVRQAATALPEGIRFGAAPEGAMNVMPVLAEIADRAASYEPGQDNHVMSLSLLPMSPVDVTFLQDALGNGAIEMDSRGYGRCQVAATGYRHVWWVRFLNVMGAVILDTLEIGDVPAAVRAAGDDFTDSAERLTDILEAYL